MDGFTACASLMPARTSRAIAFKWGVEVPLQMTKKSVIEETSLTSSTTICSALMSSAKQAAATASRIPSESSAADFFTTGFTAAPLVAAFLAAFLAALAATLTGAGADGSTRADFFTATFLAGATDLVATIFFAAAFLAGIVSTSGTARESQDPHNTECIPLDNTRPTSVS